MLTGGTLWITIPLGAFEIESLNFERRRKIIEEGRFNEAERPFQIKPNFSTLGSIVEISYQGPSISFLPNDSLRVLLGFKPKVLQEYSLSDYTVDILSFDNILM